MHFMTYFISRLISCGLVILIGITVVFLAPRFTSQNPALTLMGRITSQGAFMDPKAVEAMRDSLMETFGLKGTLLQQYLGFLRRSFTGDFGPSLAVFPTPVKQLVYKSLPWTIGLLLSSTLIAWIIGNILGLIAGYLKDRTISKILEPIAIIIYPIPYYIMALTLILFFSYTFHIFPISVGGRAIGLQPSWNWQFIKSTISNSILPALSIIIVSYGWWFLSMKALSLNIAKEDYVLFAEIKGLSRKEIMKRYILRNALLPQITQLAMSLGTMFSGALLTEVIFSYPGLGTLMFMAVTNADYNLMIGITSLSIIAVALAGLLLDFIYPLLDPRIRYH